MRATAFVLLALAPAAFLATLALPAASAEGCTLSGDPTCYVTCPVEHLPAIHDCVLGRGDLVWFADCPPGTNGPAIFLGQMQVTHCWY